LLSLGIVGQMGKLVANAQGASSQPPVFTIPYGGFSHFQGLRAF